MPDDWAAADFQKGFGDGGAALAQSCAASAAKNHRLHLLTLFVTQAVSLRPTLNSSQPSSQANSLRNIIRVEEESLMTLQLLPGVTMLFPNLGVPQENTIGREAGNH